MINATLPKEFNLKTTLRYQRQNMTRAMRGRVERGLVELITNSDDSYRDLEDSGIQTTGKIRIEVERKRRGQFSILRVRDRAAGMSDEEMYRKIGVMGDRTSGFEKGKLRRGLYGRGAKDVAVFGCAHFESIKNDKYSHFIIFPTLICRREASDQKVTKEQRFKLGIPRGNGTVVTIDVDHSFSIPLHEKLVDILSRYYSLRDIMANPSREITLLDVNTHKSGHLMYKYPEGRIIYNDNIDLPGYSDAKAHLLIRQHDTPFSITTMPLREGILIKSGAAIHDCTYFQLESEPYSWRFSGELVCDYIDTLVREYDDIEENSTQPVHPANNPILLLDPDRDGLVDDHPFSQTLKQISRQLLRSYINKLKETEAEPRRKVTDDYLNKKLDNLSKEISKVFEKKLKELDEEIIPGSESMGDIGNLPVGLHIIPPEEEPLIVGIPKVFTVKVIGYDPLDETLPVSIETSNDSVNVRTTPVYLRRFSEDRKIGKTTFILESDIVGAQSLIEINYNGYNNVILVNVIEPPAPPSLPDGLSFDKSHYQLQVNKEKTLYIWLKTNTNKGDEYSCDVRSDNRDVVIKGGGKCLIRQTEHHTIYQGKCKVIGRRSKAKAIITASVEQFGHAQTKVNVEEKEPSSHLKLEFIPDEDDFGTVRYKWDEDKPHVLKIAAKHPSIRQYLGVLVGDKYPGIDSPLYHGILAEVVAEALAFNLLERQFRTEGQQGMLDYTTVDANYHKHYSDFLTICHRTLNPDGQASITQPRLL